MRIDKSCDEKKQCKNLCEIAIGTVFRFGEYGCGPYLRTNPGYVDLRDSTYYRNPSPLNFNNYVELPKARLVTGEGIPESTQDE